MIWSSLSISNLREILKLIFHEYFIIGKGNFKALPENLFLI